MMDKMTGIAKLFEILDIRAKIRLQISVTIELLKQQFAQNFDQQEMEVFLSAIRASFDIDIISKSYALIYAKYYTDEDIMGLLQLYQTPAGKKMLEVEPLLTKEIEAVSQQLIQAAMESLTAD